MTEWIAQFLARINGVLWGPFMLVLLLGVGLYLSFATRWFQLRRLGTAFKETLFAKSEEKPGENLRGITPFRALTTALSGTLGTGSMAGVATAITLGGPGALLWMNVSALVGMMTKYAEIALAVRFRRTDADGAYIGGPMVTLERGLNMKTMAAMYAAFGLLASFGVGNIAQANTLAVVVSDAVGVPAWAAGAAAALLVAMVIIGGVKRVAAVTVRIVPAMSLLYILGSVAVLVFNAKALPGAIKLVFEDAFGLKAATAGIAGEGIRRAMRYGVSRGVFTNEAGMGSAAIAHASANTRSPANQGLWGILEVFIDTTIVCTISGLVILAAGPWQSGITGSALVSEAFQSSLGAAGKWIVTVSLTAFAFATFLGWSHYGEQCLRHLGGSRLIPGYRTLFAALVLIGAVMNLELAWAVSDVFNGLMIIPNILSIALLSPMVLRFTKEK